MDHPLSHLEHTFDKDLTNAGTEEDMGSISSPNRGNKAKDGLYSLSREELHEHYHEMELQLQYAGEAGLKLVEELEFYKCRTAELEEEDNHNKTFVNNLREEVTSLKHQLSRKSATCNRALAQLDMADKERDRLQQALAAQVDTHHEAVAAITRKLENARKIVRSVVKTSDDHNQDSQTSSDYTNSMVHTQEDEDHQLNEILSDFLEGAERDALRARIGQGLDTVHRISADAVQTGATSDLGTGAANSDDIAPQTSSMDKRSSNNKSHAKLTDFSSDSNFTVKSNPKFLSNESTADLQDVSPTSPRERASSTPRIDNSKGLRPLTPPHPEVERLHDELHKHKRHASALIRLHAATKEEVSKHSDAAVTLERQVHDLTDELESTRALLVEQQAVKGHLLDELSELRLYVDETKKVLAQRHRRDLTATHSFLQHAPRSFYHNNWSPERGGSRRKIVPHVSSSVSLAKDIGEHNFNEGTLKNGTNQIADRKSGSLGGRSATYSQRSKLLVKKQSVARMQQRHKRSIIGVKLDDMTEADRKHIEGLERRSAEIDREILGLDLIEANKLERSRKRRLSIVPGTIPIVEEGFDEESDGEDEQEDPVITLFSALSKPSSHNVMSLEENESEEDSRNEDVRTTKRMMARIAKRRASVARYRRASVKTRHMSISKRNGTKLETNLAVDTGADGRVTNPSNTSAEEDTTAGRLQRQVSSLRVEIASLREKLEREEKSRAEETSRANQKASELSKQLLQATLGKDEAEEALAQLRNATKVTEEALRKMHKETVRAAKEKEKNLLVEREREAKALAAQIEAEGEIEDALRKKLGEAESARSRAEAGKLKAEAELASKIAANDAGEALRATWQKRAEAAELKVKELQTSIQEAHEEARDAKDWLPNDSVIVGELRRQLAGAERGERDLRNAYILSSRSWEEGARRLHAGFIQGLDELKTEVLALERERDLAVQNLMAERAKTSDLVMNSPKGASNTGISNNNNSPESVVSVLRVEVKDLEADVAIQKKVAEEMRKQVKEESSRAENAEHKLHETEEMLNEQNAKIETLCKKLASYKRAQTHHDERRNNALQEVSEELEVLKRHEAKTREEHESLLKKLGRVTRELEKWRNRAHQKVADGWAQARVQEREEQRIWQLNLSIGHARAIREENEKLKSEVLSLRRHIELFEAHRLKHARVESSKKKSRTVSSKSQKALTNELERGKRGEWTDHVMRQTSPPPPPPPPLPLAHREAANFVDPATVDQRNSLSAKYDKIHAKLAQALDVIWLCLGRDNIRQSLSEDVVKSTLERFQKMRDASLIRRASFSVYGAGVAVLEQAVSDEKADLARAMEVVRICIKRDEAQARGSHHR